MQMPAATHAERRADRPSVRLKWLHRIYSRSNDYQSRISRRFTPAGLGILMLVVASSFLAMSQPRDSSYQLFSLALAITCISVGWASIRKTQAEACRELPAYATAGVKFRYQITLRNLGTKKLAHAYLREIPSRGIPLADSFIHTPEPGEEERNAFDRFFAYYRWQWLQQRNRTFDGGFSITPIDIPPGESIRVSMELLPRKRGIIHLQDLRILLPDPLGLFQKCSPIASAQDSLVVLPRRFPIPSIELPGTASFRAGNEANTNSIGNHGEFVGLRDYRNGDPLRLIHWKSWARTGRPIVKELEDAHFPRHGMIIDTFAGSTQDAAFEELISVAASLATGIDTHQSLLDLMFIDQQAHHVTVGRNMNREEKLLEVLAGVNMSESHGFDQLAALVANHGADLNSCMVIMLGWDSKRAQFLSNLRSHGVLCIPIHVGFGSKPDEVAGHWIDANHLAHGLATLTIRSGF